MTGFSGDEIMADETTKRSQQRKALLASLAEIRAMSPPRRPDAPSAEKIIRDGRNERTARIVSTLRSASRK
jgi:hypothetical protein